jgi:competence CoiA-like predicted nuclease
MDGYYYEELRKKMRKESQANAFTCPECGELLILNAGPILPPYFSHHKGSTCVLQNNGESKEHRMGRFLLYQIAKKSFPKANVRTNYVHQNLKRSNVYIEIDNKKIAMNYLTSRIVIKDWEEKHAYYSENNIIDVWVLSKNTNVHMDSKNISLNSFLASETSITNTIKLLDTVNNRMTLVHFMPSTNEENITSKRIFEQKSYGIADVKIDLNGEFYSILKELITLKNQHEIEREILNHNQLKMNNQESTDYNQMSFDDLMEESHLLLSEKNRDHEELEIKIAANKVNKVNEVIEENKVIDYKIQTGTNINHCDDNSDDNSQETLNDKIKPKNNEKIHLRKDTQETIQIKEYAVIFEPMKNTFLFKATNLYWELPTLKGTLEEIKKANAKRLDYFKQQDLEIQSINIKARKEKRIEELKSYIESKINAKDWFLNPEIKKKWRKS